MLICQCLDLIHTNVNHVVDALAQAPYCSAGSCFHFFDTPDHLQAPHDDMQLSYLLLGMFAPAVALAASAWWHRRAVSSVA
jgi:hypothetical protein